MKNYILKIEAQIFAVKIHVKCELSTLANKTETISLNLSRMVNAQQESVNKIVGLLQQSISYVQKELVSKNETKKIFLEVQSTMEHQQNQPMSIFNLQNQYERQSTHQSFRLRQHLQTNVNIEQSDKLNEQSSDFSEKILYIGNLSPVVTEEDL